MLTLLAPPSPPIAFSHSSGNFCRKTKHLWSYIIYIKDEATAWKQAQNLQEATTRALYLVYTIISYLKYSCTYNHSYIHTYYYYMANKKYLFELTDECVQLHNLCNKRINSKRKKTTWRALYEPASLSSWELQRAPFSCLPSLPRTLCFEITLAYIVYREYSGTSIIWT